jgi:dinuclear metal center YbgI/SA1388 family protein
MKCRELLKKIEHFYPVNTALGFDNVGLLCGRYDKEVQRVYIALDATDSVIADAARWQADLLITHHPMMLSEFKRVTDDDYIGRRLIKLIQDDISYYAMHTNYDVMGLGVLDGEILGLDNLRVLDESLSLEESNLVRQRIKDGMNLEDGSIQKNCTSGNCHPTKVRVDKVDAMKPLGIGVIGDLPTTMTLEECCQLVKSKFNIKEVKVFGDLDRVVKEVGIAPGSGRSTIPSAIAKGIDVLVTGDIGHHEGLNGIDHNLAIIDAGHYNTEYPFIEDMKEFLLNLNMELEIKTEEISTPYLII